MKLSVLLMLLFITSALASEIYSQSTSLSIKVNNMSLEDFLNKIEEQSEFSFFYSGIINVEQKVSGEYRAKKITEILDDVTSDLGLRYKIIDKQVILFPLKSESEAEVQQNQLIRKVTGRVEDIYGDPIPGVNIYEAGNPQNGVISGIDGSYSIDISSELAVVSFSFIGFVTQEIEVAGRNQINITLVEESIGLDEVVAIGYGYQKKVNLSGAVGQLDAKQIEKNLGANTSQVLQGMIPNVNVTFSNGGINEKGNINVRGVGSINGSQPLVLIDGVEGDMNMINPKDIQSISVLKDAASASIYGARAAFGVVLITTKTGKPGDVKVNYNANFGWSSPTIRTDNFITDGLEWARLSDKLSLLENTSTYLGYGEDDYAYLEARKQDPTLPSVLIKNVDGVEKYIHYGNTDWWSYIYSDSQPSQEHTFSISGGADRVKYYLSGRYYNRKGIYRINPDVLESYTLRSKVSVDLSDAITISNATNIHLSEYDSPATNTRNISGSSNHEDWRKYTFHASPLFNPTNPDGSIIIQGAYTPNRDIADGTFADLIYGKSRSLEKDYDVTNTTSLSIDITKGLTINSDYSFRKGSPSSWVRLISTPHTNQPGGEGVTLYKENKQIYKEWQWERMYQAFNAYANYELKASDKHSFSGVIGFNQEWRTWKRNIASRNGNLSEDLNSFNLATGENITLESDANEWAIRAAFYRLNYSFEDKYLIEFNGRFDLSSKFPKNDRLGVFPSASAAWRISEENFFEGAKSYIDNLKLRASYGTLGNQNVGPYDYISTMGVNQGNYISNGVKQNYLTTPNPISSNFTWETSETIDFGVDITALNNRFSVTYDWYQRNTYDMLTQGKKLPSVFGAKEPDENAADLRTRGFELSLNWNSRFAVGSSDLNYSIGLVLADYTTVITKFDNPNGDIEQFYVGQEVGEVWGYTFDGFFQSDDEYLTHADQLRVNRRIHENYLINHPVAGDIKFADLNSDGIISAGERTLNDHGDLKRIGNTTPRYTYGINLGADYVGFDFQAFFQGVWSQDWWPGKDNGYFFGPFSRQYQNFYPESIEANSWTPDNRDAYFPRLAVYSTINQGLEGSQLGVPSDRYLQDVGYIRLKNITLGYTLPKSWTSKVKLEKVRIYSSGSNLLTFSKLFKNNPDRTVDPEQLGNGNAYPFSKTIVFGIDINF
ncbi:MULTISPECIES: SusC/RagA family TonB-linked outer membrane protein [unclassified Carboxylicivirga]|uniref:SusC/RagA family TonB-linked outer membrane protein n=1 Tax=Carboxylicivirga TaxID=1628153 RepID=UPI003D34CFB7